MSSNYLLRCGGQMQNVSHPWPATKCPALPLLAVHPAAVVGARRQPCSWEVPFAVFVLSGACSSLFVRRNGTKIEKTMINLFISQGRPGASHHANWSRDCGFPGLLQVRVESYGSTPLLFTPWARPCPYRAPTPHPHPPTGCSIWLSLVIWCLSRKERALRQSPHTQALIIQKTQQALRPGPTNLTTTFLKLHDETCNKYLFPKKKLKITLITNQPTEIDNTPM